MGRPLRKCEWCGEDFEARQEYRSFKRRFCSPSCAGKHFSAKAIAKYPPKEVIERLYREEGLTDRELGQQFGKSYQWAFKVRQHYGIPGRPRGDTREARKPLARRSHRARWNLGLKPSESCRSCGAVGVQFHLHHVVPRSLAPSAKFDLRNGLQLCGSCHHSWHQGKPISREVFSAEEWDFIETLIGADWLDRRYPAPGKSLAQLCQRGHRLEGDNVMVASDGKRRCRECANLRARRYREGQRA